MPEVKNLKIEEKQICLLSSNKNLKAIIYDDNFSLKQENSYLYI